MTVRLLAILFVLCFAGAAKAQNVWSTPGSACVPGGDSVGRYTTDTASIRHAASEVGPITFTCQMDRFNSGTTEWNLKITYRDSTGTSPSAFVRARVYVMPIGTATPALIAEVNSNSSAAKGVNTLASPQFNHTFDYEANSYWVEVALKRTNVNQAVIFYSAVLDGTAF